MAKIKNVELVVKTDPPGDRAHVLVSCDLEFTEFEVNAMNMLGLRYLLDCRVLNRHLVGEETVVTFRERGLRRAPKSAKKHEHAAFEKYASMADMNEHLFAKDKLVAEVTLRNEETGVNDVMRSEVVAVNLVA